MTRPSPVATRQASAQGLEEVAEEHISLVDTASPGEAQGFVETTHHQLLGILIEEVVVAALVQPKGWG